MELCELIQILEQERADFQREVEQAVMQHDLYKATAALGGKDACDRVLRLLRFRVTAQHDRERRRERNRAERANKRVGVADARDIAERFGT